MSKIGLALAAYLAEISTREQMAEIRRDHYDDAAGIICLFATPLRNEMPVVPLDSPIPAQPTKDEPLWMTSQN